MEGRAGDIVERIGNLKGAIEDEREKFKEACAPMLADIKDLYVEAKAAGISVKALRKVVRRRDMERKMEQIPEGLELSERAVYASIVESLGPLGQAAADRAGYKAGNGPVEMGL